MFDYKKTLHELKSGMVKFPQEIINVKVKKAFAINDEPKIQMAIKEIEKRLQNRGRVLLRPSGTEPVIRVMVEGEDKDKVQVAAQKLADVVQETIS